MTVVFCVCAPGASIALPIYKHYMHGPSGPHARMKESSVLAGSRPAKQMHRGVMRFLRVLIFVESRRCISANQPDSRRCRLAGEPADPSRVHKPTHVHTLCEPTLLNPAFVSASASAPSCALPARDRHVTCRGPPTQPRIQPLPLFPSKPFQPRRRRL